MPGAGDDKAHLALLQEEKHESKLTPGSGAGGKVPEAIAHTRHREGARDWRLSRPTR